MFLLRPCRPTTSPTSSSRLSGWGRGVTPALAALLLASAPGVQPAKPLFPVPGANAGGLRAVVGDFNEDGILDVISGGTGWGSEPAPWPREPGSCDGGCPGQADAAPGTGGDRPARR